MAVLDPACVDFSIENVARLGLTQQEALDALSDGLVAYILLDGEAVLGGNRALVKAKLPAGAVVVVKEREHSVKQNGTHTVYFSSSLNIINQKPMIPRIHFHCTTTWVAPFSG